MADPMTNLPAVGSRWVPQRQHDPAPSRIVIAVEATTPEMGGYVVWQSHHRQGRDRPWVWDAWVRDQEATPDA